MRQLNDLYVPPPELFLGTRLNERVPVADQKRQRREVETLLARLRRQPGVILADEVGMGKTFVALAIAYSVAMRSPRGPVIVMVPANLVDKWEQDLKTFCDLYLANRRPVRREEATPEEFRDPAVVRFGIARHSIDLMKLLDDAPKKRCHLIFLAHGAMGRRQSDKWVRLALIGEALRRHGRGNASRLIKVKEQIHRFLGELLWAIGEEKAHDWGDELWQHLLRTDPRAWKDIYNRAVQDETRRLTDEPVPKSVARSLERVELRELADALKEMPVRARGGDERLSERLGQARDALRKVEGRLWNQLLAQARWRSPLLVMDEAHHLKNPATALARQLQSPDLTRDLRTGDGAMAHAFDRMLFLTATPFQLGHHELVRVLERFGDVRWEEDELGTLTATKQRMENLGALLDSSQRTAIAFQRSWRRLREEDIEGQMDAWWERVRQADRDSMPYRVRAMVDAFDGAKRSRDAAAAALAPWVLRHNKGACWADTTIARRQRIDGTLIRGHAVSGGLPIPPVQLLPFFLAARSATGSVQDLLGEALSSSYEAFRYTRKNRDLGRDEDDEPRQQAIDLSHAGWYLSEFDRAMEEASGSAHPKVSATVKCAVDLWEAGEKVLVFAFYRRTCQALRVHISREIERRLTSAAQKRIQAAGRQMNQVDVDRLINRVQRRYFDDTKSPGRRAVDTALKEILEARSAAFAKARITDVELEELLDVMRRFLRVATTLVRCFPLEEADRLGPAEAVARMLDRADASGVTWRRKFDDFVEFLTERCSTDERRLFTEAAERTQTRGIRVDDNEDQDLDSEEGPKTTTLANVQVATGRTKRDARSRLMRAFNTPFFPDILVCSEVMGEGVDLQRFCRHVIHHDLAWNPSTIEQRTGRIDRLGCKAEGRQPIAVYLPYLAGAADERQYRVMADRERWFRVVMGQEEVAQLIRPDSEGGLPLPEAVANELSYHLAVEVRAR